MPLIKGVILYIDLGVCVGREELEPFESFCVRLIVIAADGHVVSEVWDSILIQWPSSGHIHI